MDKNQEVILGYARCSTSGQTTDYQVDKLWKSGCDEVYDDVAVSGKRNSQSKVYRKMFKRAQELREQGYPVKIRVLKLDRFGRSTRMVLEGLESLVEMGASFETLDGGLKYEANNAHDELVITIFAALAKFERELITSRMKEGRDALVAKGLKLGPKPVLTEAKLKRIRKEFADGATDRELAKDWDVSRSTIHRAVGLYGFNPDDYVSLEAWEKAKRKAQRS